MKRFYGLAILLILLLSAVFAYTHSGRTDKNGGHYDRRTGLYHYHNSGTVPRTNRTLPTTPDVKTGELENLEWMRPYIPTKMEWLILQLNARYSHPLLTVNSEYVARFSFENRKNVVEITVHYAPRAESQKDKLMAQAKEIVVAFAKIYGWERWIQIEEKFKKL